MKLVALLGLMLVLAGASVSNVAAQQPTQVRVPLESLATPISRGDMPNVHTLGEVLGWLTIYADGQACGRLDLAAPGKPATAAATFTLGSGGQPAACSKEGASLTFVDGQGNTLYQKLILKAGTVLEITNLAPEPPSAGSEPLPPSTGLGGEQLAAADEDAGRFWPWALSLSVAIAAMGLFLRLTSRPR